jgi:hypothetical protein
MFFARSAAITVARSITQKRREHAMFHVKGWNVVVRGDFDTRGVTVFRKLK